MAHPSSLPSNSRSRRGACSRFLARLLGEERAVAAVEFAFLLPVLLLILFGVVQFGFLFVIHNAMSNAAHEEARYIAVSGGDITGHDVTASVMSRLSPWSDRFGGFTVTSSPPQDPAEAGIAFVQISFDMSGIAFGDFIGLFVGETLVTRASSQIE